MIYFAYICRIKQQKRLSNLSHFEPGYITPMEKNNIPQPHSPITSERTIDAEKKTVELAKERLKRMLYLAGGIIALGLGIIGLVVPGLPTTPLVLLAAALLAKSNESLYNWLLNNKILGPRIRNYQRRKGVTMKGKYRIVALMLTMVLVSSFVIIQIPAVRLIVLTAGAIGTIVVLFVVPTAKNE